MKNLKTTLLVALLGIGVTLLLISFVNFDEMSIKQNSFILVIAFLIIVGTIITSYGLFTDKKDTLEIYYKEEFPPAYKELIAEEEELISYQKDYLTRLYELQEKTDDPDQQELLQAEIEQLRVELDGKL